MSTELSKWAANQFNSATEGSFPLMNDLLADSLPKLADAVTIYAALNPAKVELEGVKGQWDSGWVAMLNREASQLSKTAALDDYMASLTRKPSAEENSVLESWDSAIRAVVPYQSTVYRYLLPQGRETLTVGDITVRLLAGGAFAQRLLENGAGTPLGGFGHGGVGVVWAGEFAAGAAGAGDGSI